MMKFENVNVIEALRTINIYNPNNFLDISYDVKMLTQAAKAEKAPRSFLWISLNDGTWCFPSRDVYIRNTPAHHTWQYCCFIDGAKAFWIELEKMQNGALTGNIVELDYAKHTDDVGHNSFLANSVELIYIYPNHRRTYNIVDYNELRQSIQDRFGEAYRVVYKTPDENALAHMIEKTSGYLFKKAEPSNLDVYRQNMIQARFGQLDHDGQAATDEMDTDDELEL